MERVRDIIEPSVEGIKSIYDCDAIEDVYTDQSTNACKIPTKTNSCETLSDSIGMDEWLPVDDNDQDDVLHVRDYLQENAGAMRQNSFDNLSDGHEMTNYDKENDIIGNDSVSDVNGNSPVFMRENNKQLAQEFCSTKLAILLLKRRYVSTAKFGPFQACMTRKY
ncbi:uncharacterized protein [Temnothorax nylanderi]|uniref:uncharacterized protein isoform X2 n=1 Tax=Temnothorax nylanderi TaxID=102681 RepID=UPI003A8B01CE